jgi:hypothetical protein
MVASKLDAGAVAERGRPMMEPIEANYVPDGDDWTITIVGRGKTLTGKAPGLIAARDRADQMVEELAGDEKNPTVVHRLDGDALEFTSAYLNARLAKPAAEPETKAGAETKAAETTNGKAKSGESTEKPAEDKPAKVAKTS